MQQISIHAGQGAHCVTMQAILCGQDVTVAVGGGTKPHVGACALAVPRPSLQDPSRRSATESVLSVMAHKDDEVAKMVAHTLASRLDCVVCVSAGLHVDNAEKQDIKTLLCNVQSALDELLETLQGLLPPCEDASCAHKQENTN